MLGHQLWQTCSIQFDTWATVRQELASYPPDGLVDPARAVPAVTVEHPDSVARALDAVQPDVVVNAVGLVKQLPLGSDAVANLTINALFPQQLARLAAARGVRTIQISTDCVFAGKTGRYTEADTPDATDLYGRTKLLGELGGEGLTLRTSIIGRELRSAHGVVEWFLRQRGGQVQGYTQAFFSGVTTRVLAEAIAFIVREYPALAGLYHVAAERLSKFDLLVLLDEAFATRTTITPDAAVAIDRSLSGERFHRATGWVAPSWPDMIANLAAEREPSARWRDRVEV
jgi:dTDP-4-dehydrorhamnose reductase